MFELLSLALIVAVGVLWVRLHRAEQRLQAVIDQGRERFRSLEARLEQASETVGDAPPAPEPQTMSEAGAAPEPEAKPQPQPTPEPRPEPTPEPATLTYSRPAEPRLAQQAETLPPEPVANEEAEAPSPFSRLDFEDIFGRRLPIWGGGIALAIAGIFLVRYAIEAGLFTPASRVIASFGFGLALIGGAEAAYRHEARVADPRVRQALAGAGIATLFGAFYLAGSGYGLIGPGLAFVGLAAVTAGAMALSFRFGLPCAVLGLVGGFAAPVLVDADSANVPLLALYLALVTGGLAWTGVRQGQRWLGYAALAIGLGWGLVMQVAGLGGSSDLAALGGYLIVLGTVLPAFLYDRKGPGVLQIIAGGVATLQMALMVSTAGFDPLTWALYLLIAGALAGLGWRYPNLRAGSAIAALVGLWLLALWPDAGAGSVLAVGAAMAAIFLAVPLVHQWRGAAGIIDIGQLAIGAVGLGASLAYQLALAPEVRSLGDPALAACLAALALFALAAFALEWRAREALGPQRTLLLLGAVHALSFAALLLVSPGWLAPVMAGALALAATGLLWRREALALRIAAWSAIAIAGLALIATPAFEPEFLRLGDNGSVEQRLRALLRWAALLPALLAMAVIRARDASRPVADALCALVAYGALAQVVPGAALPALAALGGAAIFLVQPVRFAAWGAAGLVALAWAAQPLFGWLGAGLAALAGVPFMADGAIAPLDLLLRLAPAAVLAALVALRGGPLDQRTRLGFASLPAAFALVALHSLYKQVFAITSLFQFEQYGMAERSVWQALLLIAGLAAAQIEHPRMPARLRRIAANALVAGALAHFAWFTAALHNPLFAAQNVGPTPLANWLALAYGVGIVAILHLRPWLGSRWSRAPIVCDAAVMALVTLLAVSLLRQAFAGPVLVERPIGSAESLLLSLLGIALALGFLWWGSRKDQRSWRIGSLVLIVLAVFKVFLIDAAGLSGLLRIASFMALGFSLIGIGWVYSRQLKNAPASG